MRFLLLSSVLWLCSAARPCSCPSGADLCPCARTLRRHQAVAVANVFTPAEDAVLVRENHRCNSESLERVMLENIGDDVKQSKLRIMEAAEALLGGSFNVICAHGDFSYITSTRLYCLTGNEAVKCYAFLSYSHNRETTR